METEEEKVVNEQRRLHEEAQRKLFFEARKRDEAKRGRPFPKLTSWSDFKGISFPEEQWLIKHILPQQGLAIIASPSGEKKTWVAIHMADCIAKGGLFVGHSEFNAQQGKVLYLDQEMSRAELQRRGKLLGISDDIIIPEELDQLDFRTDEDLKWLYAQVKEHNIKAVFIDTLRAVAGGLKEDKAEEVREFTSKFVTLKNQGVCVVFLDHCRKPSQGEGKIPKKEQLLGSQDKLASVEVLLMIKSDERSEEILVYPKKNRTGIERKPFRIEMKDEVDEEMQTIGVNFKYAGEEEDKEYKIDQARNIVMNLLEEGGKKRQELLDLVFKIKKIGHKNTSDSIRELQREGLITAKKIGRENFYELGSQSIKQASSSLEALFDT